MNRMELEWDEAVDAVLACDCIPKCYVPIDRTPATIGRLAATLVGKLGLVELRSDRNASTLLLPADAYERVMAGPAGESLDVMSWETTNECADTARVVALATFLLTDGGPAAGGVS